MFTLTTFTASESHFLSFGRSVNSAAPEKKYVRVTEDQKYGIHEVVKTIEGLANKTFWENCEQSNAVAKPEIKEYNQLERNVQATLLATKKIKERLEAKRRGLCFVRFINRSAYTKLIRKLESAIEKLEAIKLPPRPLYHSYRNTEHCKAILTKFGYKSLSGETFEELATFMSANRSGRISLKDFDSTLTSHQVGRVNAVLLDFLESKGVSRERLYDLSSSYHYIDHNDNKLMPVTVFSNELIKAPVRPQLIPVVPIDRIVERRDGHEREFGWLAPSLGAESDSSPLQHAKTAVKSGFNRLLRIFKQRVVN